MARILNFFSLCLPISVLLLSGSLNAAEEATGNTVLVGRTSSGLSITLESQLKPLSINQIHSWLVRVNSAQGEGVSQATLMVTGGMPDHDHGLPTQPQITAEIAPGVYLLEGVRFHMNGRWVMTVELTTSDAVNSTAEIVNLELML